MQDSGPEMGGGGWADAVHLTLHGTCSSTFCQRHFAYFFAHDFLIGKFNFFGNFKEFTCENYKRQHRLCIWLSVQSLAHEIFGTPIFCSILPLLR